MPMEKSPESESKQKFPEPWCQHWSQNVQQITQSHVDGSSHTWHLRFIPAQGSFTGWTKRNLDYGQKI
jgi:hypothetical protein